MDRATSTEDLRRLVGDHREDPLPGEGHLISISMDGLKGTSSPETMGFYMFLPSRNRGFLWFPFFFPSSNSMTIILHPKVGTNMGETHGFMVNVRIFPWGYHEYEE